MIQRLGGKDSAQLSSGSNLEKNVIAHIEPRDTPRGAVAMSFARALVEGEYAVSHQMLAAPLRMQLSQDRIRRNG